MATASSTANGLTVTPEAVDAAMKVLREQFMTTSDDIHAMYAAVAALCAALPYIAKADDQEDQ